MKVKNILLTLGIFGLFLVGTTFVSAKLLFGITTTIASGATYTSSAKTASYDHATVELEPTSFTNTSYSKKTLLKILVYVDGAYEVAVSGTKSLGLGSYTYFYNDIGAGKWKISLKQANATGTTKYAGMTTGIGLYDQE